MRTIRAHIGEVALISVCVLFLLVALLFRLNYTQGQDIKQAQVDNARLLRQIQQSRVVLSLQGCHQRNKERAVSRANLRQNLANLARAPDAAIEQFGFSRAEAIAQIRKQIHDVAPIDCKQQVRQVRNLKEARSSRGGGPGVSKQTPRPTVQAPAERKSDPGAGSNLVQPDRPAEPGPAGPKPTPSPGEPPSGNPSGPKQPEPPVIDHPNPDGIVQSLVDGVGKVVQQLLP